MFALDPRLEGYAAADDVSGPTQKADVALPSTPESERGAIGDAEATKEGELDLPARRVRARHRRAQLSTRLDAARSLARRDAEDGLSSEDTTAGFSALRARVAFHAVERGGESLPPFRIIDAGEAVWALDAQDDFVGHRTIFAKATTRAHDALLPTRDADRERRSAGPFGDSIDQVIAHGIREEVERALRAAATDEIRATGDDLARSRLGLAQSFSWSSSARP